MKNSQCRLCLKPFDRFNLEDPELCPDCTEVAEVVLLQSVCYVCEGVSEDPLIYHLHGCVDIYVCKACIKNIMKLRGRVGCVFIPPDGDLVDGGAYYNGNV